MQLTELAYLNVLSYEVAKRGYIKGDVEIELRHMGFDGCYFGDVGGIQYLALHKAKEKETVLVFSGTNELWDWKYNLKVRPKDGMHRGFLEAYKEIEIPIRTVMINFFKRFGRTDRLRVTGHSLGGAVAQIFSWMMGKETKVEATTFGSPRVFTRWKKGLNQTFQNNVTNVQIKGDPVTRIPLLLYKEVGKQVKLTMSGDGESGNPLRSHSMKMYLKLTLERDEEQNEKKCKEGGCRGTERCSCTVPHSSDSERRGKPYRDYECDTPCRKEWCTCRS